MKVRGQLRLLGAALPPVKIAVRECLLENRVLRRIFDLRRTK
jgi:hypothetical protein